MQRIYHRYAPIYGQIGQGSWSERMARWALAWLARHDVTGGSLIDWGCGEGSAAQVFAEAGWRVTGVDRSAAMLDLARPRSTAIRWLDGDLRSTRLDERADVATSFYDTLNYLATREELDQGWRTLAASIVSGGYAIVDVNTLYEYETSWDGRHTIVADTDDLLVINRLRYHATTGLARGRIVWFARDADSDYWRRASETHLQRAHTDADMRAAIAAAGLFPVDCRTPQDEPPSPTATRLIYVARKP